MNTRNLRYVLSAEDRASGVFARVRAEMASAGKETAALRGVFSGLAPQLAGAFTVAALGAWVRNVVAGVDALNDLKDATGASIENLSALEDIALRTGTSMDTASTAVIKLNQALNTASDPKSDAASAIKALGLSVEELKALDPVQALQRIGVALSGFADDGNKGRIVLTLLGKSARDLAPLLKDLAEAGKLQAKVTTEQAEEAEKLRKEWSALEKDALDLSRSLAGPLVSAINETIELFRRGSREGKGFFQTLREEQLKLLGVGSASGIDKLQAQLKGLDAALANPQLPEIMRAGFLEKRAAAAAELARQVEDAKGAFLRGDKDTSQADRPSLPSIADKADSTGKTRKEQITEAQTALASYVDGLSRAIERERDLSAEQEAQVFLKTLGVTGENAQVRELVLSLAAEKDMREELAGQAKLEAGARSALIAQQIADQQRLNQLLDATPSGKESERLEKVLFINKAFDEGKITLGQWNELTAQLGDNIEEAGKAARSVGEEIGLVFSSAAGEAITNWQGVGNVIRGILKDLAQVALKNAVTDPLSKATGDYFNKIDWGSVLGGLFGGGRAGGGPVSAGRIYEVNERGGPGEMFNVGSRQYLLAGRNGNVVPQGGGGGVAVYNTNHFGAGVSRNEVVAALEVNKRQTIAAIADAQRRGYAMGSA